MNELHRSRPLSLGFIRLNAPLALVHFLLLRARAVATGAILISVAAGFVFLVTRVLALLVFVFVLLSSSLGLSRRLAFSLCLAFRLSLTLRSRLLNSLMLPFLQFIFLNICIRRLLIHFVVSVRVSHRVLSLSI